MPPSRQFQDLRANKSSSEEDAPASSDFNQFLDPTTLLFSTIRDVVNLRDFHPPPMQAFMLWQTFLQNVNPLSKVIHAPLVQPIVIEASKDFDTVPKPSIALLFAIYSAAVMSLKDEDCQSQLNAPKTLLLTRYFSACQQALAATSFMNSRNLATLQAFVIFLVCRPSLYQSNSPTHHTTASCTPNIRRPDILAPGRDRSPSGYEVNWRKRQRVCWRFSIQLAVAETAMAADCLDRRSKPPAHRIETAPI